jgi:pSer/pThr/pTyr-binding forkhead associated (FHA) protein
MSARLIALTDDTRRAIGAEFLTLSTFPFRIGRESRTALARMAFSLERRLGSSPQLNDVYLQENPLGQFFHISREHFMIDRDEEGAYFLTDRGSVCGTTINGETIGGDRRGGRVALHDHDVIVVGTPASPYSFRFRIG